MSDKYRLNEGIIERLSQSLFVLHIPHRTQAKFL
jgi:hypothetical protein